MSESPEQYIERTAKIERLDSVRRLGARAAHVLDDMRPVFDEMRKIYHRQLVENSKQTGRPDEFSVWLIVALSDIETMLREQAGRGSRATQKLKQLENAGGSE